jgi:DNA-binding MarR family transcriptional regulator
MKPSLVSTLINQVLATSSVLLRESQRFFRPLGVSEAQFNVLNVLHEQRAGLSQRELSDVLVVDRSNVTLLLDRMEKERWVARTDDPADRRIYRVTLTPAGRKLHARLMPLYLRAIMEVMKDVPEAKVREASAVLREIEQGVGRWSSRQRATMKNGNVRR